MHPLPSHPRVLFILKLRETSSGPCSYSESYPCMSSGLLNSAKFVADLLHRLGIHVKLVQVVDANDIDREVHAYKPTHVVLEAVWVPPTKFQELIPLHPSVKWIVRVHSEIPFLANEGMAIRWLLDYIKYHNVVIAPNSLRAVRDFRNIVKASHPLWTKERVERKVAYLPNYYPLSNKICKKQKKNNSFLDVGCFGAVRPMKNQLIQALAAVEVAKKLGKTLRFHMNGTRIEQGGETVTKNVQALMDNTGNTLVRNDWLDHKKFVELLETLDIGMQVSFSETFNLVSADMVAADLPMVVSPEIPWANYLSKVSPTSTNSIVEGMLLALNWKYKALIKKLNFKGLKEASREAKHIWFRYLHE